jgi:opacity protein-like surface antigen
MMKKFPLFGLILALLTLPSLAQVHPDAYRVGHKINVGGEYALFNSDYFGDNQSLNKSAFALYGNYSILNGRWPVAGEINFSKMVGSEAGNGSEYSLLIGPTIGRNFGRLEPFAKVGLGIGHFSYSGAPPQQLGTHLALGFGGGLEYHLTPRITLRPLDYTYERWNFSPNALSPSVLGFGASYRIH